LDLASAKRASAAFDAPTHAQSSRRDRMAKNIILWMLGVPISVLILLNVFGVL
jgi:hypothetical protein